MNKPPKIKRKMKYKLINKQTGEEHLCKKVRVLEWDYYVSDEKRNLYDFILLDNRLKELPDYDGYHIIQLLDENLLSSANDLNCKKVIATNNPRFIHIPKFVGEIEKLAKHEHSYNHKSVDEISFRLGFKVGYNKSQETHSNSDDDMIEFLDFSKSTNQEKSIYEARCLLSGKHIESKELLQLWKEQRTKKLYYDHPSVH